MSNRVLHHRYELGNALGSGGMGIVYEAFDRVRGESVALKTLRRSDPNAVYHLKREFRELADVEHPNLVRLYDLEVADDACFITMERVDGVDFVTHCRSTDGGGDARLEPGQLPPDLGRVRAALRGLVRGVLALHDADLVHRDLKPSNVLVTREGRVVILDFGLVRSKKGQGAGSDFGVVVGSASYMAPEQVDADVALTPSADLYAVGAMLFEALTGTLPFEGSPFTVLTQKVENDAPRVSSIVAAVPPDLDDLVAGLLDRDPEKRPKLEDVAAIAGDVPRTSSSVQPSEGTRPPIVGRASELERILGFARSTPRSRAAIFTLRGRAGIGKSALLDEAVLQLSAHDHALVFAGHCYAAENVPFKGLDDVVDALARHLRRLPSRELEALLPEGRDELATVFPSLRRLRALERTRFLSTSSVEHARKVRAAAFGALRTLFGRLSTTRLVVVSIDDAHWAGEDTAYLLAELCSGTSAPPIVIVLSMRPSGDGRSPIETALDDLRDASAGPSMDLLELGPLAPDERSILARRELGPEATSAIVGEIAAVTEGIPFEAIELARFVREGNAVGSNGRIQSVAEIVRGRVRTLDVTSRELVELVCVAGEPTKAEVLLRAASLDPDDRSPIETLRARRFLRTVRSGPRFGIDFTHDLIRESVLSSIDDSKRRVLHLALAHALDTDDVKHRGRLARHFAAAGERELARANAMIAAREAQSAHAEARAANLLWLAYEQSDDAEKMTVRPELARALERSGRYASAAEVWLESANSGAASTRITHREQAGLCLLRSGRMLEGLALLRDVAASLGIDVPVGRRAALWELAKSQLRLFVRGTRTTLRLPGETASAEVERLEVLATIAVTTALCDPIRGASAMARFLIESLDVGDPAHVAIGLAYQANWCSVMGQTERAGEYLETLDAIARSSSDPRVDTFAEFGHGMVSTFSARFREGRDRLNAALQSLDRRPDAEPWERTMLRTILAVACVGTLDLDVVRELDVDVDELERAGDRFARVSAGSSVLGYLHVIDGRLERIDRVHRQALAQTPDDPLKWASGWSRLMYAWGRFYAGDTSTALAEMRSTWRAFEAHGTSRVPVARGEALRLYATLELLHGGPSARAPVRMLAKETSAQGRVHARLVAALDTALAGDRTRAAESLEELATKTRELGWARMEVAAVFGLTRLLPAPESHEALDRLHQLGEHGRIRDIERYAYTYFPIGTPPRPLPVVTASDPQA